MSYNEPHVTSRILLFVATLLLVPLLTYFVILFARGYRPNLGSGATLQPTGILAATSLPEGAQLYINGQFKSATDTTLNLIPGTYEVEIKKETYHPWKKTLEIKAEEVTRASALLFPSVPTLKAITTAGAGLPSLSPDGTKIAFGQTSSRRSSIYVLDLNDSPLGILNRDPRFLGSLPTISSLTWSPDSKQLLLAAASPAAYLTDVNGSDQQFISVGSSAPDTLAQWQQLRVSRERQKASTLPPSLQNLFATASSHLVWSPKEDKLLYTATASATLPNQLIRPLPGSSTQPQRRDLEPGGVYVYDIEEDRNFKIDTIADFENCKLKIVNCQRPALGWFPTSAHLIKIEPGVVTVLEYDGGNPTVVYQGPMEDGYAFPYPSSRQLLILTNLDSKTSDPPNLYAVSLR